MANRRGTRLARLMAALIPAIAWSPAGGAYHVAVAEGGTASAAVTACSNAIAACGCTITKPGIYDVTADLASAQGLTARGGCIDVLAKGVLLFLNGYAITRAGTMTGVGIHLLAGANGAVIEGTPTPLVGTDDSIVSGWEEGVEVESNNSLLDSIAANQNKFGALLNKAHGNNVAALGAESNAVYGVWLRASSSNQIDSLFSDKNGSAGLYLGCSASGPIGKRCKGVGTSNKNLIYSNFIGSGGASVSSYGIAIDLGNTGNLLTERQSRQHHLRRARQQPGMCREQVGRQQLRYPVVRHRLHQMTASIVREKGEMVTEPAKRYSRRGRRPPGGAARLLRTVPLAATIGCLLFVSAGFARAGALDEAAAVAGTPCANSISACGCVIKKAGTYTVQNDLTGGQGLTPTGDCIDVAAAHVVLLLDGFNLTGNGTGVGLHVMPKAANFFVAGFRSKTSAASTSYTTFSGWDTGAEFDASKGVMEYFQANDNAAVGILLNRASGINVNEMSCLRNGVYGIWLKSSSSNQINISASHNNGNTGVYLGCSSDGPNGHACQGAPSSSKNRIFNHSSGPSKSSGNTQYGIAIDTGDVGNLITNTESGGNGTADLLDNNPNYGTNIWHTNTFNTVAPPANAGCIH